MAAVDYEPRNDPPGMVGKLVKYDCGRELPLGPPIFDVARVPFSAGGLASRRLGKAQLWPLAVDVPGRPEADLNDAFVALMGRGAA
mgnify:CR=1 FL=1